MRKLLAMAAGLLLPLHFVWGQTPNTGASATTNPPAVATPSEERPKVCTGKSAKECGVSKEDFKRAREAFERGMKLRASQPDEALSALELAVDLVPRNIHYVQFKELVRQQALFFHIQRGNALALQKHPLESITEFRKALELDPGNQFASKRLRDIANANKQQPPAPSYSEPNPEEEETVLQPQAGRQTLNFNTDTRNAYLQAGTAFGVKVTFDDSTPTRSLQLQLDQVTFAQAMDALATVTRTFWTPVSASEVLVAADKPEKHKEFDRWLLRTFYLPDISTPQEFTDIVNLLRTLFDLRMVTQAPASDTITIRGPAPAVVAATQFIKTLWTGRPQVMLDFEVYDISRTVIEAIGAALPLQFQLYNIPESIISALSSSNVQQLISAAGGLSGNSSAISALAAQLGLSSSETSELTALLSNPVATFGGGLTMFGIPVPPATFNLSKSNSYIATLDKVSMRAAQGDAATFRLGSRYPVMNGQYSGFTAGTQLSSFPQFTYVDLGLTIKAKPIINESSVTLDLDLEITSLGTQSVNDIPIINNQSFKGVITVKNNEPAVVANALSRNEQSTLQGVPFISSIPVLGPATNSHSTEVDEDELLILIIPHILSHPPSSSPAIAIPTTR